MRRNRTQPFTPEPWRLYDGDVDAAAREEFPPVRIELVRHTDGGREQFAMQRRIAYRDRHLGELLAPADIRTFLSDLTSVPALFTWLVPKTGRHLPATLLHDGLIHPPENQTYTSTEGHTVRRVEADRVLRDAMGDAGTALIRRWLVWSAVATATMLQGSGTGWSKGVEWYYRGIAVLTLCLILVLGIWASLDLFDVTGIPKLPWMGDRPWWVELVGGLSGAVVIPLLLAALWLRFWIAGAVVGVSVAALLYVEVALLALTAIYQGAEWATARKPKIMLLLVVVGAAGALALFLLFILAFFHL
ncbi:DUF1353 domain-containing protein [Streptomyces sp. NPDC049837]|uniref:DUF1353 domain-containing protein n=1 Tax=Streptomyces sp. NPDC049837 TaxID=3155277 RepID=UPI00342522ED